MKRVGIAWNILVGVIIVFFIIRIIRGSSESILIKNIERQSFEGIIEKKFIDTNDHFGNKISIKGVNKPIHWKFYMVIAEGDSIVKKRGDTTVEIYTPDGAFFIYDLIDNTKKE
ncbi:MAG: hypothetical protein WCY89_04570 [Flavobacteriaceae bacterium]